MRHERYCWRILSAALSLVLFAVKAGIVDSEAVVFAVGPLDSLVRSASGGCSGLPPGW